MRLSLQDGPHGDRKSSIFPDTHWSLIHEARGPDPMVRKMALTTLLERYQPALRSYLWSKRKLAGEEADELLQAFIADRVLEQGFLGHAHEAKGRFRTFLLSCLNNFSISRFRKERLRRSEPGAMISQMPGRSPAADKVTDAAWARALIQSVLRDMEAECHRSGRMDIWTVFRKRVLADVYGDDKVADYEQLAEELRLSSPMQAANLLVTAKRMYARLLRDAVGEYESNDSNIEFEIAELRRALEADSTEVTFGSDDD